MGSQFHRPPGHSANPPETPMGWVVYTPAGKPVAVFRNEPQARGFAERLPAGHTVRPGPLSGGSWQL